jgi:hypothetical protein
MDSSNLPRCIQFKLLETPALKKNFAETEPDLPVNLPARKPREGWEARFREMARRGDDAILDDITPSQAAWDEDEWEW